MYMSKMIYNHLGNEIKSSFKANECFYIEGDINVF